MQKKGKDENGKEVWFLFRSSLFIYLFIIFFFSLLILNSSFKMVEIYVLHFEYDTEWV